MKKGTFAIFLFISTGVFAQNITKADLEKELRTLSGKIKKLESENSKQKSEIVKLNSKLTNANKSIQSLGVLTHSNSDAIIARAEALGLEISKTERNTNQKINAVDESLGKKSLIGTIIILITGILSAILYWLLFKKQKTDKIDIVDQLSKTKSSIEESLVKEFGRQTELMNTQLQLVEQQRMVLNSATSHEPDHSLALKVASEINLIERNINLMDSKTKGLKQLQASVRKLKDNLSANGYEMPELIGKQFHQGMKVIVTSSIPDENLEKDSEIISKILIPQVNYNDKMIQTAQLEVSVGY